MSGATLLSPEVALAAACTLLDDDRLAATVDSFLERRALNWTRFLIVANYHWVERLACARLETLRPGIISKELNIQVQGRALKAAALHASQTRMTVTALAGLQNWGVPGLVLKGAGVAHLLYPENPEFRTSGDIDILVAPENFRSAELALVEMGFVRTWPTAEPSPGARPMLLKLANVFDFRDPSLGHTVELHCRATMNPHALTVPFAGFLQSSVEVVTKDGPVRTLDGALNIAYLCHHATTSMVFRLKWLGDIARAERRAGDGDCANVVRLDPRALPLRPARLVSKVLRYFEGEIESTVPRLATKSEFAPPLRHVLSSIEATVHVPDVRSFRRLPLELANLRFVLSLLPEWRAKGYEFLRFLSDPRDALTLRLSPRFSLIYALAGPIFAVSRLVARLLSSTSANSKTSLQYPVRS